MRRVRRTVSARMGVEPTGAVVRYPVSDDGFAQLLEEMRSRAGLSVREIAAAWGVYPNAIYQYFHKKRGQGGSGTLRWFLRYASVCGCEVTVTFPNPVRGEPKVVLTYGENPNGAGSGGVRGDGIDGGPHRGGGQVFLGRGADGSGVDRVRGDVADAGVGSQGAGEAERRGVVASSDGSPAVGACAEEALQRDGVCPMDDELRGV
jgi:hypothetical protein